jgi:hypothetical protein
MLKPGNAPSRNESSNRKRYSLLKSVYTILLRLEWRDLSPFPLKQMWYVTYPRVIHHFNENRYNMRVKVRPRLVA